MRKPTRTWTIAFAVVFITVFAVSLSLHAQGPDSRGHEQTLTARPGELKVTSFPSGAHVSIDGAETSKVTPMRTDLLNREPSGPRVCTRLGMEFGHSYGADCFRN